MLLKTLKKQNELYNYQTNLLQSIKLWINIEIIRFYFQNKFLLFSITFLLICDYDVTTTMGIREMRRGN